MQISLKTWQKYKNRLASIDEKAVDEMLKFLQQIGGFGDHAEEVIRYAYALSNKYGEAAAAAACEMYDAVAEASGVNVPLAEPADMPDYKEVARAVNGTVKNSSESMIPKTVGRLVKRAGADTTLKNALRDGAQFAWVPTGDTCAFCLTLASRGWQYASEKALKNGHAEHIHGNCDCQYAIRFDDKTNIQGYDPDKYLEMYNNADGKSPKDKINALRRAHYAENKDKINAQKRMAYAERSLRTKSGGNYGVNWKIIKSKEYTSRFDALTDNTKANALAAKRARNALVNRNGKNTEEIYAISITTGKDVSSILDQQNPFGIERTPKFMEDISRAEKKGEKVLLIHNHPGGSPPSIQDINELLSHSSTVGITVGHDGSIYYYTRPNKEITDFDIRVATRKAKGYNDANLKQLSVLEELQKTFSFVIKEL